MYPPLLIYPPTYRPIYKIHKTVGYIHSFIHPFLHLTFFVNFSISSLSPSISTFIALKLTMTNVSAVIVVDLSPYFLDMLKDVMVSEGMSAVFVCKVYPDSAPVVWHTEESEVSPSDTRYKISTKGNERRLEIVRASRHDYGIITASVGELQSNATLTVEGSILTVTFLSCNVFMQAYTLHTHIHTYTCIHYLTLHVWFLFSFLNYLKQDCIKYMHTYMHTCSYTHA